MVVEHLIMGTGRYGCRVQYEKVATLSQQLTWSHFVELLPIQDELKRDFYAAMCKNENWSVRILRERKKSMLYERTAISRLPEETIKNEIVELRDEGKMSLYMFYRDPFWVQGQWNHINSTQNHIKMIRFETKTYIKQIKHRTRKRV